MKRRCVQSSAVIGLLVCAGGVSGQTVEPTAPVDGVGARDASASEPVYVDAVRAHLDRGKRYPTGREASLTRPSGAADVWFVLSRDGQVGPVGLQRSSGSPLLDAMASSLVRRTAFPAFPADAWAGEPSRRFSVRYAFDDQPDPGIRLVDGTTPGR